MEENKVVEEVVETTVEKTEKPVEKKGKFVKGDKKPRQARPARKEKDNRFEEPIRNLCNTALNWSLEKKVNVLNIVTQ